MDLGMHMEGVPGQGAQVPMGNQPMLDPQMMRQILMEHADLLGLTEDVIRRMTDEQVVQVFQQVQDSLMQQGGDQGMSVPQDGMGMQQPGMEAAIPPTGNPGAMGQVAMGYGGYIHPMQVSAYQELPVRSPDETLAENQHRWADARDKAANSTAVRVLQGLSDVTGLIGAGAQAYASGNWSGFSNRLVDAVNRYDTGGMVPVEVEGQEMFETPQGQTGTFVGPSHEEGGMPVAMPEGTKIYSQRVEEQGQSMAERKRRRDAALRNAELELERRPTDPIAKRTLKRIQEINAEEDARDMEVQSLLHEATHQIADSFRTGGVVDERTGRYIIGLPRPKFSEQSPYEYEQGDEYFPELAQQRMRLHRKLANGVNDAQTKRAFMDRAPVLPPQPVNTFSDKLAMSGNSALGGSGAQYMQTIRNQSGKIAKQLYQEDERRRAIERAALDNAKEGVGSTAMGVGDIIKAYAHINAVNEAERNQLNYEASQQPFRNQYRNFGNNAIAEAEAQKPYIQQQLDNQLKQLRLQTNADKTRMRNTAGSVNTLRALDVASEEQHQTGVANAYQQAYQQMQAVRQHLAALQNERDAKVMAGEDDRDLNQREQEAQNYKNRDTIIASRHKALESIGTIANNFQQNKATQDLLNRYSKYGNQANASTGEVASLPTERIENSKDELYSNAQRPAQDYPSNHVPSLHGKQPNVKEVASDPLPENLEAENDEARRKQEKLRMEVHQAKLDNLNAKTEQTKALTEAIRNPRPNPIDKASTRILEPTSVSASGLFSDPPQPGKTREESLGGDTILKKHQEMEDALKKVNRSNYRITNTPEAIQEDLESVLRSGGNPQRLLVYFLEQLGGKRIGQLSPEQGELLFRYIIDLTTVGEENQQ